MPEGNRKHPPDRQPVGLTLQTGGLASEYAREQGWGTNEEQRTKMPEGKQDADGGTDYDYGARDFGDTAVDTSSVQPEGGPEKGKEKLRR